jgi:hypothetical protein
MKRTAVVISSLPATPLAVAVLAQVPPASEIDAHVLAARTAAGLDCRATFVNLEGLTSLGLNPRDIKIRDPQPFARRPPPGRLQRYFTVMVECAMASKLRAGAK